MIATLLKPESYTLLQNLTRLNNQWEIKQIPVKSLNEILKTLESGDYSTLLIDIMGVNLNVSAALSIIERICKTSTMQVIVIAQELDRESPTCRDIVGFGVPEDHLITSNDTLLKKALQELLPKTKAEPKESPEEKEIIEQPSEHKPDEDLPIVEAKSKNSPVIPKTVKPASKITTVEAKQNLIHKPPVLPSAATIIAIAGAGRRIGVTTQAMQTLLYLKSQDRKVALIEYHDRPTLSLYLEILSEKEYELIDESHYKLFGCDIYRNASSFLKIKSKYDYIILDYGAIDEIKDITGYLEKDIIVVVGGVKPFESNLLEQVFAVDDGSIKYIFSFVPKSNMDEVRRLMEESGSHTYFASYSPDFFNYCGDDEMYAAITNIGKNEEQPQKKKPLGLFRKGAGKWQQREESN